MAPKRPTAVTFAIFDDDDASLMEMPTFLKAMPKKHVPRDDGSKKRKLASSQTEKAKGTSQEGHERKATLAKPSNRQGPKPGKNHFLL